MKEKAINYDAIYELRRLTALLGMCQTAFAEGSSVINHEDASDALYHLYVSQCKVLKEIEAVLYQ